jgi:competence protein ComEA
MALVMAGRGDRECRCPAEIASAWMQLNITRRSLMKHTSHSRTNTAIRRSIQGLVASLLPVLAFAGPVDINKADAATIAKELNGIGKAKAQAIVAYRDKNGAFKKTEELLKVQGIGQKVLDLNKSNIRLDGRPEGAAKTN